MGKKYRTKHELSVLIGRTAVTADGYEMTFSDGSRVVFDHEQDCCESVDITQVDGEWGDIIGNPLLMCEEVVGADGPEPEHAEGYTWTFYKFATSAGYVTVRWLGQSNGFYSESVDYAITLPEDQ